MTQPQIDPRFGPRTVFRTVIESRVATATPVAGSQPLWQIHRRATPEPGGDIFHGDG